MLRRFAAALLTVMVAVTALARESVAEFPQGTTIRFGLRALPPGERYVVQTPIGEKRVYRADFLVKFHLPGTWIIRHDRRVLGFWKTQHRTEVHVLPPAPRQGDDQCEP